MEGRGRKGLGILRRDEGEGRERREGVRRERDGMGVMGRRREGNWEGESGRVSRDRGGIFVNGSPSS